MLTSCASLQDLELQIETRVLDYPSNSCVTFDLIYREYVDCYTGLPLYRRPYYNNYFQQPQIIIKPRRNERIPKQVKDKVRVKGRRGQKGKVRG